MLRRQIILLKRPLYRHIWPINKKAYKAPEGWGGWPDQKRFALVLTHDVDTERGLRNCLKLAKIEESMGLRSSFNFVPKLYNASPKLRRQLINNGFEVGIHGLIHDGKLFSSKKTFQERAIQINHYLKEWEVVGFRSPSMHHNLDWLHDLDIEYDASTFDTDPFEPQSDGVGTIFPFWVQKNSSQEGYVELPYTLPQDFTLFVLMRERTTNIWKRKLDWIVECGGMALVNTHPDFMNFHGYKQHLEEYPTTYYEEFLEYTKSNYQGIFWHALPKDLANYYKNNLSTHIPQRYINGKNCLY